MGHSVGSRFFGDLDEPFGNKRARYGGAQKIKPFVDSVCAEHREDEIVHELFAQVFDVDVGCAHHLGFFARGLQLFALTKIGREGYDFAAVFGLQPLEDDRCIKTAGIGEHDFFGRGHSKASFSDLPRALAGFAGVGKMKRRVDLMRGRAYRRSVERMRPR